MFNKLQIIGWSVLFSISAHAVVIDFEVAAGTSAPIQKDGFTVSSSEIDNQVVAPDPGFVGNGTNVFGFCTSFCGPPPQVIHVTHDNSELFSLTSIDAAYFLIDTVVVNQNLVVTGYPLGLPPVTQSFSLLENTYSTFNLSADFVNLTWVDISSEGADISIDNIVVIPPKPQISINGGYIKLDINIGVPPPDSDCTLSEHAGRMVYDPVGKILYICDTGWSTFSPSP